MPAPPSSRPPRLGTGEPASSPSIYEVARTAGVSVATVSRVLNGKGPVRAETRRRVLAAVEGLGFVPHSAARSLSTRRTMTIGVLLPDMHGEFFSELVRGIDLAARAAGYHLLVSGSHSDAAETAAVLQALHGRVDGLIVMTPALGGTWLRESLPKRVPVVLLNHETEPEARANVERQRPDGRPLAVHDAGGDGGHDALGIDNRLGARLAVRHLIELGHRTIAIITGPPPNADAAERLLGYREALREAGITADQRLEIPGDFGEESGDRAGGMVAALSPRPSAVFAANDSMALGCVAAFRERGIRIPEDISLVGFDDIPIARYLSPPLTTVQVPIAELGRRAMGHLLAAIEHGGRRALALHEVIAPRLAIRGSTAAAASPAQQSPSKPRRKSR